MGRKEWQVLLAKESGLEYGIPFDFHDLVRWAKQSSRSEVQSFGWGVDWALRSGRFSALLERWLNERSPEELVDFAADVCSGADMSEAQAGVVAYVLHGYSQVARAAY